MNADDYQYMLLDEKYSYKWHSYLCIMLSLFLDIRKLVDLLLGEEVVTIEGP